MIAATAGALRLRRLRRVVFLAALRRVFLLFVVFLAAVFLRLLLRVLAAFLPAALLFAVLLFLVLAAFLPAAFLLVFLLFLVLAAFFALALLVLRLRVVLRAAVLRRRRVFVERFFAALFLRFTMLISSLCVSPRRENFSHVHGQARPSISAYKHKYIIF